MIGGLLKTTSRMTIAAAATFLVGGLTLTPATAADLGGDCCADLEERVAELEASTARHANKKVSLTIYGWVNQAMLFWDDGVDHDFYVVDNDHAGSRFGLKGEGKLREGVSVGYKLEIGTTNDALSGVDNRSPLAFDNGDDAGSNVFVRQENVWISSAHLGKLTLGQQGSPLYDTNGAVDLGGGTTWSAYDYPQGTGYYFDIRDQSGPPGPTFSGVTWYEIINSFGPGRDELIRYDTPDWNGFHLAAAVGEDDVWSLGAWYNGSFSGTDVAFGVANRHVSGDDAAERDDFSVAASVYNGSSGIFFVAEYDLRNRDVGVDGSNIYLKGGWRKNVNGMGETALYGEWSRTQDATIADVEGTMWGLGVTQDLDAVGATMYLHYRNLSVTEGENIICFGGCEDFSSVLAGMVVTF